MFLKGKLSPQRRLLTRFVEDVPIGELRHDDKPVHRAEGYGGRPIDAFPPVRFFREYLAGRLDEARDQFRTWYREQFHRYADTAKSSGGMQNGSLYRLVAEEHRLAGRPLEGPRDVQPELLDQAIERRVEQRFEMLESIRDRGYDPSRADPVIGVLRADDTVALTGGHHRAAALLALDKTILPGVFVLSPMTRYVFSRLRIA